MIDRVHGKLTDDDIRQLADTYHAWRGDKGVNPTRKRGKYEDIPGLQVRDAR